MKEEYNKDHPDNKIEFDRAQFEGEQNRERLGGLATETLSLRDGDVSRSSGPDAPSQSGEAVHVTKKEKPEIEKPTCYQDEVQNFEVKRGDTVLETKPVPKEITDPTIIEAYKKQTDNIEKSKQVHIGEQNIVDNSTEFKNDKVTHTITVADGDRAPYCTTEAISDHVGEFGSAKNGEFVIEVKFEQPCSEAKTIYNDFKSKMESKYDNVTINYPWGGDK